MNRRCFWLVVIALVLGGCSLMQPPQPAHKFNGTLHSVRPAGGGAPTGWVLNMGMAGMPGASMDLDVSKVKSEVEALDGKTVQVTAVPKQSNSGQVLEVESIGVISQ